MTVLLVACSFGLSLADDDDHGRKRRHNRGVQGSSRERLGAVNNPIYKEVCGGCHFAYQPGLLPSGSWEKILAQTDDHFGQQIDVEEEDKKAIALYLQSNAAEYSGARCSQKIMRSLGGETPLRITQTPYIRHKHEDDDIPSDAFQRKSVGSFSNCVACHKTAEQGIYNEDYVEIPRQ